MSSHLDAALCTMHLSVGDREGGTKVACVVDYDLGTSPLCASKNILAFKTPSTNCPMHPGASQLTGVPWQCEPLSNKLLNSKS